MKKKHNKKAMISLSILLGIAMLATTAFADVISRSPYDQLKDAVKSTSAVMSGQVHNYTTIADFKLLDNGNLLMHRTSMRKIDTNRQENTETNQLGDALVQTSFSYSDPTRQIWYDQYSDTYYVTEFISPEKTDPAGYDPYQYSSSYYDPLAQDYIEDVEKIFDAIVGNLKTYVLLRVDEDGSKTFSASLSDAQIPALINAVASFMTKQYLMSSGAVMVDSQARSATAVDYNSAEIRDAGPSSSQSLLPTLSGDIFIKSVSGLAATNPDGLVTQVELDLVLTGKDPDGNPHDLNLVVELGISDIGSTTVTSPDLTGKNVQINRVGPEEQQAKLSAMFVGTYHNDIIIEQDNQFIKVGERKIVIESIDQESVTGFYQESYVPGFEDIQAVSFSFTAENVEPYFINFTYLDENGKSLQGSMYFDQATASIHFYPGYDSGSKFHPVFPKVFD